MAKRQSASSRRRCAPAPRAPVRASQYQHLCRSEVLGGVHGVALAGEARRASPTCFAQHAVLGPALLALCVGMSCAGRSRAFHVLRPAPLCRGSNAARQPRQRRMSLQCSGAAAAPAITVQCRGALGKGGPGRGPGPGGGWAEAVGATRRAACVWPRAQRRKVLIGPTTWLGPQTARRGAAGARARAQGRAADDALGSARRS